MNSDLNLESARRAGAQDLVVAIFAQAVEDYLKGGLRDRSQAAFFLSGTHAQHLADLASFSAEKVWAEAQRQFKERVEACRQPRIRAARQRQASGS